MIEKPKHKEKLKRKRDESSVRRREIGYTLYLWTIRFLIAFAVYFVVSNLNWVGRVSCRGVYIGRGMDLCKQLSADGFRCVLDSKLDDL